MKKFLEWIKGPKSDFILFLIVLVLANFVSHNSYIRFDLTQPKSYSLSKASKQLVKTLEEPLSVRVFFDDNLPAPYNSVAQYVNDILVEYSGAANKNFNVTHMDMKKNENAQLANEYGLRQIQIQEVKNNEVGFKQVYMGLVVSYGDKIEVLDAVTSSDGFEYNFTSKLSKMINTANTLAGLSESQKITLTLYLSKAITSLGISGSDQVSGIVEKAFKNVNKQNFDRLSFKVVNPTDEEVKMLSEKYGIQTISYKGRNGSAANTAAFGLVLEMEDNFRVMPVSIQRSLFGYGIAGLDTLEDDLTESLQSLLSKTTEVGYIIGHNELDLANEKYSKNFDTIVSKSYKLTEIDLSTDSIPANMNSIIINGPQYDFTEEELYKIDQFLMRGGNIMFFIDSLAQDGTANYYGGEQFVPNEVNLDRLLNKYGVKRNYDYVMDKKCYTQNNSQYGKLNMYWVPILQKNQLAKRHPITSNLGYVIMLQNGSLDTTEAQADKNIDVTVLARSSKESWTMTEGIMLNPLMLNPPADTSSFGSKDLTVLLEGKFKSAFDQAPEIVEKDEYDEDGNLIEKPAPVPASDDDLQTVNHLSQSILPGKIFVMSTSYVTTYQILDDVGNSPIAMMLMNTIDYMNGNEDLCTMRTKGLSVNTLEIKSPNFAKISQYFNEFGIAVLVVIAGFVSWRIRSRRRKSIRLKYNPEDSREIVKSSRKEEKKIQEEN